MIEKVIIDVALVILAWAGAGLITYGFIKAKMMEFERRLITLEATTADYSDKFVTRIEYDNRHADLIRQLDRIESKIDMMRA